MLALDDARWSQLQDAYGTATAIPQLLRALAVSTAPAKSHRDEPWFSLWSRLCHQGDVYTASYASVPHIVQIACDTGSRIDFSFFQLPAAIEIARAMGHGPEIPDDLSGDYKRALVALIDAVARHRAEPWDRSMVLSVAAALAVGKGHPDVAQTLLNIDDDWIGRINENDVS